MRDCALMSLNITSELITQPVDISSKLSLEEKKEEYTVRLKFNGNRQFMRIVSS